MQPRSRGPAIASANGNSVKGTQRALVAGRVGSLDRQPASTRISCPDARDVRRMGPPGRRKQLDAPREPSLHPSYLEQYRDLGLLVQPAMYHAAGRSAQANPEDADGAYNRRTSTCFRDVDAARPLVQRAMAQHSQIVWHCCAQRNAILHRATAVASSRFAKDPEASRFIRADTGSDGLILVWCLRQQGNSAAPRFRPRVRTADARRRTPGVMDGLQARMAAAIGNPTRARRKTSRRWSPRSPWRSPSHATSR